MITSEKLQKKIEKKLTDLGYNPKSKTFKMIVYAILRYKTLKEEGFQANDTNICRLIYNDISIEYNYNHLHISPVFKTFINNKISNGVNVKPFDFIKQIYDDLTSEVI